jgi:hypothetical protein
MSRKIWGVKTPPTAAAPVDRLFATDCTAEGNKLYLQMTVHFQGLTSSSFVFQIA